MRILLAEDETATRLRLESYLKRWGYEVASAKNGQLAWELFEGSVFQMVISDWEMPIVDGIELVQRIRSAKTGSYVYILMLTSRSETSDVVDGMETGADDFLKKPFDRNELRVRLRAGERILELEKSLEARNADLQKANQQLGAALEELRETQAQLVESEKMASLGQLVTGVAHEINTPVGICVTAASHIAKKTGDIFSRLNDSTLKKSDLARFLQDAAESGELLLSNARRAAELIQSFKQVSVDQSVEKPKSFGVQEFFNELPINLEPQLKGTELSLEVTCNSSAEANSFPSALNQILAELVTNSLVHAYDDGEKGSIHVDATNDEGNLKIRYSDDGRGIPAENLEKIFDPFFTTSRDKGNGLGLQIVYNQITSKFGGTVQCESVEGEGATFSISVPLIAVE
ncbi:MAG: response regulator [Planctomycetota bacterium]|jgi:two-component system sensor histidine kinase ChiS|nr:response regulator [Planctomycetota bacterium]MDP6503629.1 response regulator [Planctomycetota bacterium]